MKKLNALWLFVVGLLIVACSGGGSKLTPEEEVRNYGKYFVEKLSANELDSLKASYPEIVNADSIVPLKTDSIFVEETAPGKFNVTLSKGINLKVDRDEDGEITVTESKGLFAFPADKVEMAKKTGMWDDNLNDAQLNQRMKDDGFFNWLKEAKTVNTSDIIALGKTEGDGYWTRGFRYVVNKTDQPIKGSDYQVIKKYSYSIFNGWDVDVNSGTEVLRGKDIPPHGSVKFEFSSSNHGEEEIKSVKLKLSQEEIQERFAPYTGKEYQEYLNSKK